LGRKLSAGNLYQAGVEAKLAAKRQSRADLRRDSTTMAREKAEEGLGGWYCGGFG
jgi:hypothetical protein